MASILSPVGYQTNSCGYCKKEKTSASFYVTTSTLSPWDYQNLVDRGWRRSGRVLYKPNVRDSCCPHYTIRLDTAQFKPTRDQRQAVNRWNRHVCGDKYTAEAAKLYPKSKEEKARQKNEFNLAEAVHGSEHSHLKTPPKPDYHLDVSLERDIFTEEKFEVYSNYQQKVHGDAPYEIRRDSFTRFLCKSPLRRETLQDDSGTRKLGSYHQCYRLDGRLIAFAVLDLLPHAVSAVYFIYHEDVKQWSFGKLSALREATLALEGGYKYYYMGFYIHSCIKMHYKGDYRPQYVLDPETYDWAPLGEYQTLLDSRKYVSLARERRLGSSSSVTAVSGLPPDNPSNETPSTDSDSEDEPHVLFDVGMPGVMTLEELPDRVDLGEMNVKIANQIAKVKHLNIWNGGRSLDDPSSLLVVIAELAAAIGPELSQRIIMSFGV